MKKKLFKLLSGAIFALTCVAVVSTSNENVYKKTEAEFTPSPAEFELKSNYFFEGTVVDYHFINLYTYHNDGSPKSFEITNPDDIYIKVGTELNPDAFLPGEELVVQYEAKGSEFNYTMAAGYNYFLISIGRDTCDAYDFMRPIASFDPIPVYAQPKFDSLQKFTNLETKVTLGLTYGVLEEDNFEFKSAFLRYGVNFEKSIYDGIKAVDANASFGVELLTTGGGADYKYGYKPEGFGKPISCPIIASLDKDGNETSEPSEITNYQYSLVINNIPFAKTKVPYFCRAYVEVNGTKYYSRLTKSERFSVLQVAYYYLTNLSDNPIIQEHSKFLEWLIAPQKGWLENF